LINTKHYPNFEKCKPESITFKQQKNIKNNK
jgi:hypothetical protein